MYKLILVMIFFTVITVIIEFITCKNVCKNFMSGNTNDNNSIIKKEYENILLDIHNNGLQRTIKKLIRKSVFEMCIIVTVCLILSYIPENVDKNIFELIAFASGAYLMSIFISFISNICKISNCIIYRKQIII